MAPKTNMVMQFRKREYGGTFSRTSYIADVLFKFYISSKYSAWQIKIRDLFLLLLTSDQERCFFTDVLLCNAICSAVSILDSSYFLDLVRVVKGEIAKFELLNEVFIPEAYGMILSLVTLFEDDSTEVFTSSQDEASLVTQSGSDAEFELDQHD